MGATTQNQLGWALLEAVENNIGSNVQRLLNEGADVNFRDTLGYFALYIAVLKGYLDMARILLDHNADPNKIMYLRSNRDESSLSTAVSMQNICLVELLLNHGADPNLKNSKGESILYEAVDLNATVGLVKSLLDHGADPNITDAYGNSALHNSVNFNKEGIASLLLLRQANPNIQNSVGDSAVHIAVRNKNEGVLRVLLDQGANPNLKNSNGDSALHIAVSENYDGVLRLVFDQGAVPNITDAYGDSAQHIAVSKNCDGVVRVLLDHGADPNLTNHKGNSALHFALNSLHLGLVEVLLKHGADPNLICSNGDSALHTVSKYGIQLKILAGWCFDGNLLNAQAHLEAGLTDCNFYLYMIKTLLNAGADASATDKNGQTALHLTTCPDVVECLLEKGAPIDAQDNEGCTPLLLSIIERRKHIVEPLIFAGANLDIPDNTGRTFVELCETHKQSDMYVAISKFNALNIKRSLTSRFKLTKFNSDIFADELEEVKKTNVEGVCLYNILQYSLEDVSFLSNSPLKSIIQGYDFKKKFPQFYLLIRMSFKEAERKCLVKKLSKEFSSAVSSVLDLNVPTDVGHLIITELFSQDLKNLEMAL